MGTYHEPSKRATKQTRKAAKDKVDLATKTKDNRARKDRCISCPTIKEKVEAMHPRLSGYAISSGLYPLPNQAILSRRTQNRKGGGIPKILESDRINIGQCFYLNSIWIAFDCDFYFLTNAKVMPISNN